jgi:hypothetical protein
MARHKNNKTSEKRPTAIRHPLLVYRNLGRRYRPPGVLLFLMGVFLFLPSFIKELRNTAVKPEALAGVGAVLVLVGIAYWLFSILAIRRAYIECRPDVLEIRTPFYRTLVSYRRIKQVMSVQVSQLFPRESLKGMGKPLVVPLLGMTAVEMQVKSWPAPKKRLMRFLSHYLFSPRGEAWVFIVPNYSVLIRQIEQAAQNRIEQAKGESSGYKDPFERLIGSGGRQS